MDNETRKRAADRDADEALDAILREIDSADHKQPAPAAEEAPRRSSRPDPERRRRLESGERSRSQQSRPVSHAKETERSEERAERPQRPRHRLPAAAERPEERSQRLVAERAQNAERSGERPVRRQPAERPQRPSAERQQRPAERTQRPAERPQRPAERTERAAAQRPAAAERTAERTERAAAQRPQQRSTETAAKPAAKRPANRSKTSARRPNKFRIGMALYISVFIVALLFGMHKLNVFLYEYESSLPEHTIDGYVAGLNGGFYTEMIRQHVDEIQPTAYETPDTIAETLDIGDYDGSGFTWSKNVKEFTNESPAYFIRTGNAAIAKVTLKQVGETKEFGKPIWQVEKATSLIEVATEPVYSLEVTVPDGGAVMVNGVAVPPEEMEQSDSALKLDDAALAFAQKPASLHIKIDGLYVAPKVQAYDSLGNQLDAYKIPDASELDQVYVFGPKEEASPDEELVDRVKTMMREYIDYMVNKDETLDINLAALDHYLVYQSNAYTKLHSMRGDIYWNNPYTNRVDRALNVSNVRMYSENLFTCDVHYDYQLTMNVVNDYIGDMRWTFVKTGDGWKASDFEIIGSNDTKFEDPDDVPAAEEG